MTKRKKTVEYRKGKIKSLVETVAHMVTQEGTTVAIYAKWGDMGPLHAQLALSIDGYGDPSTCLNCGRGMRVPRAKAIPESTETSEV